MSDVRRQHRRMKAAVEDGDIGRAIELRSALQERTASVAELLDEFEAAVRDGAYDEAETVRHQLRERFSERRIADKKSVQRSTRARQSVDLAPDEQATLAEHTQSAIELTAARSSFLTTSTLFLIDPEEAGDEEVLTETTALVDREQTYETRESEAETVRESVSVPADVALLGGGVAGDTMAVGSPATVAVRVGNVGDQQATGVTVTVEPPASLSATPAERSIGDLDGGAETTVEFTVTGTEPGTHRFGVTVNAETGGSSHTRLALDVDSEGSQSPLIEAFSGPDGSVRFEDVVDAIAHFNSGDPVPGTDDPVAFGDVLWIIEAFNGGD